MAVNVPGSRALYSAQLTFKQDLAAQMQSLLEPLQSLILKSADLSGAIPQRQEAFLISRGGDILQRFFVGPDFRQAYGQDGVTPLAPYPELLNRYLANVTYSVAEAHSTYMKSRLPEDVQRWLMRRAAREQTVSNPRAEYNAPHTWVDPGGYRLSDRIWRTSVETRAAIDKFMVNNIRAGRGAFDMSKELEQFLLPTRAPFRTRKPYGRDASFDAMRLARSEIGRAHSFAAYTSSLANPFVDGWDWGLSARHPRFDICDSLATIGMGGERLREPYPLSPKPPIPIQDSHPQCLCTGRPAASKPVSEVIAELRAQMGRGEEAPITPIDPWRWVKYLLGGYLAALVVQRVLG